MGNQFSSLIKSLAQWDAALSQRIVRRQIKGQARTLSDWAALLGAHLGDSWLWALVAGLLFWDARTRRQFDHGRRLALVRNWIISVIASIGLTLLVKQQVQRTRPGHSSLLYGGGADVHSFPSGHAARLATIAVWASALQPGLGWWAWLLAGYVGWSRVALGIHYIGDVLVGWLFGSALGWLGRSLHSRFDQREN